ncbi:alpha/beta-hydrolase [Zopfia rhizophila CBS 207.26]|uniref:Alpha/beta-hydrolase n=1 Tax=Zopfia rhizophila CBS 207.26 TaxID=1314779 RepID=A0A6A6E7N8_9PEZI|nr:alpha/beta-hydrolase [Zopfia rhizophila CBS 207.26]
MYSFEYAVVPLAFISGIWIPAMLLCSVPWVQKQMLYLHRVTLFPGKWLDEPERAGFLKNQVAPFLVPTKDGERLFAWLIAPLGMYSQHVDEFVREKGGIDRDMEERLAFRLLNEDPEARLLVYFHGNTATVAQGRRTEEYRMYASGASEKIFILTFDYRGFGRSTGSPSETGCLNDGAAVLDWALNVANISPDRIILLGHSLGTAIATGTAHQYIAQNPPVEFAGLILCASFTNAGNAFSAYSIGGVLPVMAPVQRIPFMQSWLTKLMQDTWKTDERLADIMRKSSKFKLVLIHAKDDMTMPWRQTEELFKWALRGALGEALTEAQIAEKVDVLDLGEAGWQEVWKSGEKMASKLIMRHGGHDTMTKWAPASLAVLQCFGLSSPSTL